MAQVFRPSANSLVRVSLILFASTPVVVLYAGVTFSRSPLNTRVTMPLEQPAPFSHKHHAWELGIDCRYCHTSVEKSSYAGIPATETCMSCHSQIWTNSDLLAPVRDSYNNNTPLRFATGEIGWNKVNSLPAFVYFDHSIHVDRGINCNTCHGPIQEMQLTFKGNDFQMRWCLECHRAPERFLYEDKFTNAASPREQVFALYLKKMRGSELTGRERALLSGAKYTPKPQEVEEGKKLVRERGVQQQQLADCWICHR